MPNPSGEVVGENRRFVVAVARRVEIRLRNVQRLCEDCAGDISASENRALQIGEAEYRSS